MFSLLNLNEKTKSSKTKQSMETKEAFRIEVNKNKKLKEKA
jgi:hypothetical protein